MATLNEELDLMKVSRTTDRRWASRFFTLLLCILACGLYYRFIVNEAHVEIEVEVSQKADFKIYWAGAGELYSEKHMSVVVARPDREKYSFFLTDIKNIARLRIDTHNYEGEATLKRVVISQEGWDPITLETEEDFAKLVPLFQVGEYRADQNGLWVSSTGIDSNFELLISPQFHGLNISWLTVRLLALVFIILLVQSCAGKLMINLRFVPILLFGAWMLIVVMAGISERNVHPDEYVHLYATSYYDDNWLPPVIDDPGIRHTYSAYGVSRLNNGEVYYLFAGKFDKLLAGFKLPNYLSLRGFNVFLFGLVFLYSLKSRYARMVALPFLLSPQIWYLFSYCNSDAFALFCAFLAGCQLVDPDSLFQRFLKEDGLMVKIGGFILLSILLGSVFLLKKNYYPFIAFFYLCLGLKMFFSADYYWDRKGFLKKLVVISLAGACILGLRVGADYMVNGADRQEKIEQLQNKLAYSWYKPSTELNKKHVSLYLKQRGTTLKEIILRDRWFEKSFQSSFGVFGYSTITAPLIYYDLMRWSGVALLTFVFCSIFWRRELVGSGVALLVIGMSGALLAASIYHSWTVDFQAQGRYLFPIFSMLGILYAENYKAINRRLLTLGVLVMYCLSVYGFVFQGLVRIPKVVLL